MASRIRPFWPINALTPISRCPHGMRIGIDRICGICHAAAKATQQEIEATRPPLPVNPEDRALRQIAFLKEWLDGHPEAGTREKLHVIRRISRLEAVVDYWIAEISPTKYQPDPLLKGGKK